MEIKTLSIATNFNTVFNCFSIHSQGLIAFASANLVCILDQNSKSPKVLFTLNGHTERVNSVAWITQSHLVSVSSDGDIVVWEVDPANILDGASYKISQRFEKAHEGT